MLLAETFWASGFLCKALPDVNYFGVAAQASMLRRPVEAGAAFFAGQRLRCALAVILRAEVPGRGGSLRRSRSSFMPYAVAAIQGLFPAMSKP
jgi:hypothetical protein